MFWPSPLQVGAGVALLALLLWPVRLRFRSKVLASCGSIPALIVVPILVVSYLPKTVVWTEGVPDDFWWARHEPRSGRVLLERWSPAVADAVCVGEIPPLGSGRVGDETVPDPIEDARLSRQGRSIVLDVTFDQGFGGSRFQYVCRAGQVVPLAAKRPGVYFNFGFRTLVALTVGTTLLVFGLALLLTRRDRLPSNGC